MHLVKTWSRMMHIMMGTWGMGNMSHERHANHQFMNICMSKKVLQLITII